MKSDLKADLKETGERLHGLLLEGASLTVTSRIAELFLPELLKRLQRAFPNVGDRHLIATCAEDALMEYLARPEKFDPSRGALLTYLRLLARSRLLNELKKPAGRQEVVAVEEAETVYESGGAQDWDDCTRLCESESARRIEERLREIITDPADWRVLELMLEGVRETDAYAEVLEVTDKPAEEQRRVVKQRKDRVRKRVRRKWRRGGAQA